MFNITLPSIQNLPQPNLSIINLPPILQSKSTQSTTRSVNLFSCNHCSTTFSRKNSLLRHMRIHTGYKPYACKACNKTFSRKDILDKHKDSARCLRNTMFPLVHNNTDELRRTTRSPSPNNAAVSRMSINSILSSESNLSDNNSESYSSMIYY